MKTPRALSAVLLLLASAGASLSAQAPPRASPQAPEQGIERHLFPPELIMQNRRALGLTESQRERITGALSQMQADIVERQWALSEAAQALETALSETTVDEEAAVELLTALFEAENEVKRTHLLGLIRIKNALTAEQQDKLSDLRRHADDNTHARKDP